MMGVRRLRIELRRVRRSPRLPTRKQAITFLLVVSVALVTFFFDQNPSTGLLAVLVGVILSTDYAVIDQYISSELYEWIENEESLLDTVRQNYHVKRYAEADYDPFNLTYWENGDFRATVSTDRAIEVGMRFKIRCDVPSYDDQIDVPTAFCQARVDRISPPQSDRSEISLSAERWFDETDARDAEDRRLYRDRLESLRNGDDGVAPTAVLDEPDNLSALTLDEWETLYNLLERSEVTHRE